MYTKSRKCVSEILVFRVDDKKNIWKITLYYYFHITVLLLKDDRFTIKASFPS